GVERARPGAPAGTRRLPPRLDGGRGLRPRRGRGPAGRGRRRLAGRASPDAPPDGLPRRGLPARRRPPAGERDGRRARGRPWRAAGAEGDRRHHRREVLPQPVRRARPGLRPRGAQHSRQRRGGRAGQHRARGADPGQIRRRFLRRRRPAGRAAGTGGSQMTAADEPFGALLAPITLRTAGERIAERLVTAIALGEFVPAERDLAAMLEVSRTTVREALQRLQAAGYVTARRGRGGGTFVQTGQGADSDEMIRRTLLPAWEELTEILDFRQLVEQLIARTAAARRDAGDIAAINAAVAAYASAADRDASRLADAALHQAIARAAHNTRLAELSARIRREV